jgi:hypothetical protein
MRTVRMVKSWRSCRCGARRNYCPGLAVNPRSLIYTGQKRRPGAG